MQMTYIIWFIIGILFGIFIAIIYYKDQIKQYDKKLSEYKEVLNKYKEKYEEIKEKYERLEKSYEELKNDQDLHIIRKLKSKDKIIYNAVKRYVNSESSRSEFLDLIGEGKIGPSVTSSDVKQEKTSKGELRSRKSGPPPPF